MTVFRTALVATLFVAPLCSSAVLGRQDAPGYQERDFLTRVRRLTVEGKRAAKATGRPTASASSSRASASPAIPSIRSM
jgi:hypothetical protein